MYTYNDVEYIYYLSRAVHKLAADKCAENACLQDVLVGAVSRVHHVSIRMRKSA